MKDFTSALENRVESYVELRRSLGYAFNIQAATLRAFMRFVKDRHLEGPLTQGMVMDFVHSRGVTGNCRASRYAIVRRFAEYLAIYDPRTESLDPHALPRSRAIPSPRILTEQELGSLLSSIDRLSPRYPQRGRTLATIIGLLASTGLRSGEALRLDRGDVDLTAGVLHVRKTKFRKDRLVPLHSTTLVVLRQYARFRDRAFLQPKCSAFFISLRGNRLSSAALYEALAQACALVGLNQNVAKALRPHDLRHRFAIARLAEWHRQNADVQALLPLLAAYLGHARYSDTAYYITGTAELLGLAAERAFGGGGVS
jgi:integrase